MIDLAGIKKAVGLQAPLEKLRVLHDQVFEVVNKQSPEDKECTLLILQRLVLEKQGHLCTIKFGQNSWNGQRCCICGVPLEQEGQAVWLISRWENSSRMLCLCDTHSQETFEVDVDMLTGEIRSQIGHP